MMTMHIICEVFHLNLEFLRITCKANHMTLVCDGLLTLFPEGAEIREFGIFFSQYFNKNDTYTAGLNLSIHI